MSDDLRQDSQQKSGNDRAVRLGKLAKLRERGRRPYAGTWKRSHVARQVHELADGEWRTPDGGVGSGHEVSVAGRLVSRREHGKTAFGHIQDDSGRLQLYFRRDTLGDDLFAELDLLDIGDIVGARGEVFRTRTGEVTVHVRELVLLAKALRPLPEKFHGLRDIELRYRRRHLDLLMNPESKEVFLTRTRLVRLVRRFLDERGFVEVETPVLQPIYGGASARPFETYYNVLEQKMFLRIADELYLKRLIVGGIEKVYEIGKDFRNEGLDRFHNPEFTQMELYWAYADYHDVMALVEELFRYLAVNLHGRTEVVFGERVIDFGQPWRRLKFVDALAEKIEADPLRLSREMLLKVAARFGVEAGSEVSRAKLLDKLFSELIQDHIVEPTFVMDHPRVTTPLARTHRENPELVERFEPVVCGMELGNAYSELNDPLEQRERFVDGARENEEYATVDEEFCADLEWGMPPTGGLGLGIDRLTMLFANRDSIRDVILFPQLRASREPAAGGAEPVSPE